MIFGHKYVNNLYCSTFTVCLLALTCYPDFATLKEETIGMLKLFEDCFNIDITKHKQNQELKIEVFFNSTNARRVTKHVLVPFLSNAGFGFLGVCVFAIVTNQVGRRVGLMVLLALAIGLFIAKAIKDNKATRILNSFIFMGAMIVGLTYTSEIAPIGIRGIIITLPGSMGIIRFIYDTYLTVYKSYITLALLALTLLLTYVFCEETPHYYLIWNQPTAAFKALSTYRAGDVSIDEEIADLIRDVAVQKEMRFSQLLVSLKIAVGLLFFQWFMLSNAILIIGTWMYQVFYKSVQEFPMYLVYAIILAPVLSPIVIEKFKRKTILIMSTFCMIMFHAVWCIRYGFSYTDYNSLRYTAPFLFAMFIVCYYVGIGTLFWVILAEIYPTTIKVWLLGFTLFAAHYFSFTFILPFVFFYVVILKYAPVIGVIILFASWMICFFVFVFRNTVVETKGKSFWEIQEDMYKGK